MKLSKFASIILASSIMFMAGCGSSTTENEGSNLVTVSGSVVDGPIYNTKVCVDYDFNGKCDANEPSAVTDINGTYTLKNVNLGTIAPIIVVPQQNTIDTVTLQKFTKKLSAPLNGTKVNVNPVTTLVGAQMYKLHEQGDLTQNALNQVQQSVAKAFGLNTDNITEVNITADPAVYEKAVAIAQVLPDVNQDFTEIDQKIDMQKLVDDGNLSNAINDNTLQQVIQTVEKNVNNIAQITDPKTIQKIVEDAIEENNPEILNQTSQELQQQAVKNTITSYVFYKQNDDGYSIAFNSDGSFVSYEMDENDNPVEYTGTWQINDDVSITLNYTNGNTATINEIKQINAYEFAINGKDWNGNNFNDIVLAIPKNITDISNLPGITPLSSNDLINKAVYLGTNDFIVFNSDGTCVEYDNGAEHKYTWKIENGAVVVTGTDYETNQSFSEKAVKFENQIFVFNTENNITKGYILNDFTTDYKIPQNTQNETNTTGKITSVNDFLNYLSQEGISQNDITPLTASDLSGQTITVNKEVNETLTFNNDGTFVDKWTEDGKDYQLTGKWDVEDNVLILTYDSTQYNNPKTVYAVKIGDKFKYVRLDSEGNIIGNNFDNKQTLVSDLVSGKVTFYDANGNQISVPQNAKIRITPKEYQVDGDWHGVNCVINSDGTFGDKCYIDIDENNMKNALENNTSQIAVYNDANNDNNWEADESAYFVEDNVTISNLKNIDVNVTLNNNLSFIPEMISDKTISFNKDFIVFKDDNTWTKYENGQVIDSGKWQIDENDGNLVLTNNNNQTIVVSLVQNLGTVLEVKIGGNDTFVDVLNTTGPYNTTINSSDDLKNLIPLDNFKKFTSDIIEGKTVKSIRFNKSYTFNSDGSLTITDSEGKTSLGSWEIDSNGVLVMHFNSDNDTSYVVLGEVDGNDYKVLVFGVNDNKLVFATPDVEEVQ